MMCEHTWLDGDQYMCELLNIKCPYIKPNITIECIETYGRIATHEKNKSVSKTDNLQGKI